jgi:hypothetical protein
LRRGFEGGRAPVFLVFQHHLEAAGIADAVDRRRQNGDDERAVDLGQPLVDRRQDHVGREALGISLFERLEHREDGAFTRPLA